MSWDKEHDYRMRDLEVIGPMVADIVRRDAKTLQNTQQENRSLREENERLKSEAVGSRFQFFFWGWVTGLGVAVFVHSLVIFLRLLWKGG